MWVRFWAFLDRCLFGPASSRPGLLGLTIRVLRYPYAVLRDLWRGDINLRAMGLVYTTLLSLIPLVAFTFAILKVFGANRQLQPIVYEFFRPVGTQAAEQLTSRVMQFAGRVSSGLVGSVGFALLAWTLVGTIKKVEDSFNYLWRVQQPRSFARRIVEYLTLLLVGPLLLVGFIGLSQVALGSAPVQTVARLQLLQRLPGRAVSLAPYVMVTVFFTGMYMFIPNTRVRWRPALIGALAGGILWAAVGKMFTAFVVYSTRLAVVYAGFAFIVAGLLWTYFGWLILLAGAQLSFYLQNPTYLRLGLQELQLSCGELEQLALRMMYFVGGAHLAGGPRWTVNGLSEELGLPGIAVSKMASALEQAGLVTVTADDELIPARDIGRVSVYEILEMARNQRSGHFVTRHLAVPSIDRLTGNLDDLRRNRCGELTLRDLVEDTGRPALTRASGLTAPLSSSR
ncbi:MAG TPA: YihY/virulence factor BrkB family protein [Steroidobacteraceae bacterium]|nr:YihY/virulence factor BrkB family protein [Steroidobacteraceae bacterium]